MLRKYCFCFLVVLALINKCQAATNYGFDLFILVRQWGPTFCDTTRCNTSPFSAFTIHGLWPEYSNGGYPEDCNPSNKFSTSQLSQPLLNQMSCEWVSYTGSNSAFWSHEWSTHGTCALSLLPTQEDYFNTTISLNSIYDPNAPLLAAGISPSSTTSSQIQSTLKQAWGVSPLVSCSSSSVYEIWLCIDTNFKAMTCPSSIKTKSCPKSVDLPKGNSIPASCSAYFPKSG